MNKISMVALVVGYVAFWISPVIVAQLRNHPKRNAITIITLVLGFVCPVSTYTLVWACWPIRKPELLTPIEED